MIGDCDGAGVIPLPLTVLVIPGLRVHQCPKVASNSIARVVKTRRFATPNEEGPEERFIPVRHPLDRLVSCWAYFCGEGVKRKLHGNMHEIGYRQPMPFDEFLEVALNNHWRNNHTRRQVDFAGPHASGLCPLHRLPEAWEKLRERHPRLGELQVTNTSRHDAWPSFYTWQMRSWAEQVFHEDMALYERSLK